MVLASLFGRSIDYDVFILSRICEEYDGVKSTDAAVVEGIGRNRPAGHLRHWSFSLGFAALASGPATDLRTLATGIGILIDATFVRSLLVPSLLSLVRPVAPATAGWRRAVAAGTAVDPTRRARVRRGSANLSRSRSADRLESGTVQEPAVSDVAGQLLVAHHDVTTADRADRPAVRLVAVVRIEVGRRLHR